MHTAQTLPATTSRTPQLPRSGRFVPFERPHFFGIACFIGLLSTTLVDVNGLFNRLFGVPQAASLLILMFCLGAIAAFRFRIYRATGALGVLYLFLMGYYLVVCSLMRFGEPSTETLIITRYYLRLNVSSPIILVSVALGMRHLCLAFPLEKAVNWLLWIAMVQIAAVFVDTAFGDRLFGTSFLDPRKSERRDSSRIQMPLVLPWQRPPRWRSVAWYLGNVEPSSLAVWPPAAWRAS